MFDKWIIGSEFSPLVDTGKVDILVINLEMSKEDKKVSIDNYTKVAEFGKIRIFNKKIK